MEMQRLIFHTSTKKNGSAVINHHLHARTFLKTATMKKTFERARSVYGRINISANRMQTGHSTGHHLLSLTARELLSRGF